MRENWHASLIEEPETTWKEERLEPMATFRPRRCLEISCGERREIEVDVVVDENVSIVLNGACVASLAALPTELKEMAVGFLIGEGLVKRFQDISSVKEENGSLFCETKGGKAGLREDHQCCHSSGLALDPMPVRSQIWMQSEAILNAVDQLNSQARLWRRMGATHTSIVCHLDGEIVSSCEDISRSSSVDKTVGKALLAGNDLSSCALITSGRLSGVMVAKAARAGFPVLVSKSAPMNSGVELAKNIGMTLVGFARRPNLYVYAGVERII